MDEAGKPMFMNQAAAGQLDMNIWALLRKEMAEKGTPLHEAIIKYQKEIAAQAVAAQQTDQGALAAPPEGGPPGEPPLQGVPPQVLAGV